jgi:hypothetical protein
MLAFDSPMLDERGRTKMFLEAKYLVEDQFSHASEEAKMKLIGDLVQAHATLIAALHIGTEIAGLDPILNSSRAQGGGK